MIKTDLQDIFLFFGLIPAILLFVSLLPESVQAAWTLEIEEPILIALFLTNFVHAGLYHLLGNIGSYLILMSVLFPLADLAGRKRMLFYSILASLAIIPFLVSLVSIKLLSEKPVQTVLGFSGVTAAFVGMLPLFLGYFLEERISGQMRPGIFSVGLTGTEFGVILLFVDFRTIVAYLMISFGLTLIGYVLYLTHGWREIPPLDYSGLVIITIIVYTAMPVMMVVYTQSINVYGHLTGLISGYLLVILPRLVLDVL